MKVLALDTTTRAGSVALIDNERVIDERIGDAARSHAERLPHDMHAMASAHGIALAEIDLFAVASGPGSFTGLRIGIATIQGVALVARRPVVAISALEALAQAVSTELASGAVVGAWMDAHRREVFAALYRVTDAVPFEPARVGELDGASVADPASILAAWRDRVGGPQLVFAGDGAVLYADRIAAEHPSAVIVPPPPIAGAIGRLAVAQARSGAAIDPAAIRPLYVRRPDAEVDRERRAKRTSVS
jgi:tRNA threonylcarbamoyladenosine biosynthesis protein TsaB